MDRYGTTVNNGNEPKKEGEFDIAFAAFVALGISLYIVMLFPSGGSLPKRDPTVPFNLFQEHSDASIKYLLEQALNRALIESHGMVSPFYTSTIQQICGKMGLFPEQRSLLLIDVG
jgi:hypothetical protein